MLFYEQPSGRMSRPNGSVIGLGGAGHGEGWNNPALEHVKEIGPLPRGVYRIGKAIMRHPKLGVYVLPLEPVPDPRKPTAIALAWLFGRSAFFIHGWNVDPAKRANSSDGCILLNVDARVRVDLEVPFSTERMLVVCLELPKQNEPESLSGSDPLKAFELVFPTLIT